jgi:hypothetical protein
MAEQVQQRRGWKGNTKQTLENGAMLGAKWWAKGDKILCVYQRSFDTKYGRGFNFMLVQPTSLTVSIDEFGSCTKKAIHEKDEQRQITQFAIPPLAGFDMALQSLQASAPGFGDFRFGDKCVIECNDIQEAKEFGFANMPMFEISVDPR